LLLPSLLLLVPCWFQSSVVTLSSEHCWFAAAAAAASEARGEEERNFDGINPKLPEKCSFVKFKDSGAFFAASTAAAAAQLWQSNSSYEEREKGKERERRAKFSSVPKQESSITKHGQTQLEKSPVSNVSRRDFLSLQSVVAIALLERTAFLCFPHLKFWNAKDSLHRMTSDAWIRMMIIERV
jgi:hypothetical protein